LSGTIVGTVTGASDRGERARASCKTFSESLENLASHLGGSLIMQDDATPTDTKTSQKRETPEDAATAQEPERRVRPRETPVGAGRAAAAAAPEPEEKEEGASTRTPRPLRAIAESSDSDDDAESSDSDRHDARIPRHLRGRKLVQRYRLMEGEVRGDPSTNPCLDEESDEAPEMDLTPIIPGLPRHHSSDPRADDWVNVDDDDDSDDDGGDY
jgi:hypothetical protein